MPNGRLAVPGSRDKTFRVWDLEGGTPSRLLLGHTSGVTALAVTADGRRAVSDSR
jgi:WD40 repeat protein